MSHMLTTQPRPEPCASLQRFFTNFSLSFCAMDGKWSVSASFLQPELQLVFMQNVHAIGDRANGIVMDVFEASLKGINISASRPRLEHAQIITQTDRERLGRLGGAFLLILKRTSFEWSVGSNRQCPTHACVRSLLALCDVRFFISSSSISDMWYAQDRLVCGIQIPPRFI
jgi:hypothetical protein